MFVRSFELSVLMTPQREAAYRAHRHRGFCVHPLPPAASLAAAAARSCPPPAPAPPDLQFWAAHVTPETGEGGDDSVVRLPVPYNLPPVRYGAADVPWTMDGVPSGPDVFGLTMAQVFGDE